MAVSLAVLSSRSCSVADLSKFQAAVKTVSTSNSVTEAWAAPVEKEGEKREEKEEEKGGKKEEEKGEKGGGGGGKGGKKGGKKGEEKEKREKERKEREEERGGGTTFKAFSSSELAEFEENFSLFEIEKAGKKTGRINADDLSIVMRSLGQYASDDDFRRMTSGKTTINYDEFLDLMELQAKETAKLFMHNNPEQEFIEAFKAFDRKGNGYVDAEELRYMMQNHGSMRLTDEEVDEMMSDADINKDGKLNFQEFVQLMMAPLDDTGDYDDSIEVIELIGSKSNGLETTSQESLNDMQRQVKKQQEARDKPADYDEHVIETVVAA